MELIIFALVVIVVFLFGILLIAVTIDAIYSDASASYKLYAVRDRLVGTVVFENISRQDPWFESLYQNVNTILWHSNFLAGPGRWPVAREMGQYLAAHPDEATELPDLPNDLPPDALALVLNELDEALRHLLKNHRGILAQGSAHRREQRRIQRAKAKQLWKKVESSRHQLGFA